MARQRPRENFSGRSSWASTFLVYLIALGITDSSKVTLLTLPLSCMRNRFLEAVPCPRAYPVLISPSLSLQCTNPTTKTILTLPIRRLFVPRRYTCYLVRRSSCYSIHFPMCRLSSRRYLPTQVSEMKSSVRFLNQT